MRWRLMRAYDVPWTGAKSAVSDELGAEIVAVDEALAHM